MRPSGGASRHPRFSTCHQHACARVRRLASTIQPPQSHNLFLDEPRRGAAPIIRADMPIYEYRRPDGSTFEVLQSFSDASLKKDPDTGVPVERVLHAPAVHFKGKGFYNTDYGTRNRQRETAASAEGSSADGASASGDSAKPPSGGSSSSTSSSSDGKAETGSTKTKSSKPVPAGG